MKKKWGIFIYLIFIIQIVFSESWIDDAVNYSNKEYSKKLIDIKLNYSDLYGTYWIPEIPLTEKDIDIQLKGVAHANSTCFMFIDECSFLSITTEFAVYQKEFLGEVYGTKEISNVIVSLDRIYKYEIKNGIIKSTRYEITLKNNKLYVKDLKLNITKKFILAETINFLEGKPFYKSLKGRFIFY